MTKCPCRSGIAYRDCCAPFHRGEREAPDVTALMRSRYAAFALGCAEYLWRTLHEDHELRALPRAEVLRSLRGEKDRRRFMGLAILDSRRDQVLFHARVFERGQDRSFVELSDFAREGEAWRYLSGVNVPAASLGERVEGLTIAAFSALPEVSGSDPSR